jgi:hypothetical protein
MALMCQVQQTSLCNSVHDAISRLSRLLLVLSEQSEEDSISFSQERLADMLGLRRSSVTVAAQALQSHPHTRPVFGVQAGQEMMPRRVSLCEGRSIRAKCVLIDAIYCPLECTKPDCALARWRPRGSSPARRALSFQRSDTLENRGPQRPCVGIGDNGSSRQRPACRRRSRGSRSPRRRAPARICRLAIQHLGNPRCSARALGRRSIHATPGDAAHLCR